jgi:hypothetical protein
MKRYINIYGLLALLSALMLLYSCAAKDENSSEQVTEMASAEKLDSTGSSDKTPEESLEAEELSREQLEAFTQRAQQKLRDLVDYIAIISDSSYEKEFRDAARRQAMKLFGDTASADVHDAGSALLFQWYYDRVQEDRNEMHAMVEAGNINTASFPVRQNLHLYTGTITFRHKRKGVKDKKQPVDNSYYTAQIIIKKIPKKFGNEVRDVWEVKLGEIKEEAVK